MIFFVFLSCKKEDGIIPKRSFLEAIRTKLYGNWYLKNITSRSELDKNYMEKYIGVDVTSSQYEFFCKPAFKISFQTHHKHNYMKFNFDQANMVTISSNLMYEVLDSLNTSKQCVFNYYSLHSQYDDKSQFILEGDDYYASTTFLIPLRFYNGSKNEITTTKVRVEFDIFPVTPTTIYLAKYRAFFKSKIEEVAFNQQYSSDLTLVLEKTN